MSLSADTGRKGAAFFGVTRRRARSARACRATAGFLVASAAALYLVAWPAPASTPRTFDTPPEDLPLLTEEMAALDPLAAEARCRAFLAALYHQLTAYGANPAWAPERTAAEPLEWVLEALFALPPASPGVRAANAAAGDLTRAYLDAFGPAAGLRALPDDPLYRNDKRICEGVLAIGRD